MVELTGTPILTITIKLITKDKFHPWVQLLHVWVVPEIKRHPVV